jgi:transcriptional regulator with XRE-family HTH domain
MEARHRVRRPRGGSYSQSLISRLEKGHSNAPLYTYVHFAEAYEVAPELLMGPDEVLRPVGEAEMTLIRVMRRIGISADDVIARITAITPLPQVASGGGGGRGGGGG